MIKSFTSCDVQNHPEIADNFPHHFHDMRGNIKPSDLVGDPLRDLPDILQEIERFVHETLGPLATLPDGETIVRR